MGNYFSTHGHGHKKKKKGDITEVDRAILSLRTQRRKLEDQSTMVEKRIEHNLAVAKELLAAEKKERALLMLKKKKMNEHQLSSIQTWLLNVEDMLNNMELRQQQNRIFQALKDGNDALKQLQKEFSVEDVEQLMEDTAEARQYQEEMDAALSGALSSEDTEEVEAELEALEAEALGGEVGQLPTAPTTKVQQPVLPTALPSEGEEAPAEVEALREAAREKGRPIRVQELVPAA